MMKHHFTSDDLTIGLELELQIIDPRTQLLAPVAKQFVRHTQNSHYKHWFKPEITQSMIEINSSVHHQVHQLEDELVQLSQYLRYVANKHNVVICGGGTHPFQNWSEHKIFPSARFREVAKHYGYLAKRFTIFSMHVHVSCPHPDKAVALTHYLSRYVPQLIALSASSPFYNGINTGFDSTRLNVVNAFPLSGHMPVIKNWSQFIAYFNKLKKLNIIGSMKDLYWDVRPKPEFGTVEVRVCDMPLTINKAVTIAAYIQTLAHHLLQQPLQEVESDYYQTYSYNRFQAARFGFKGQFINPFTLEKSDIQRDILRTVKSIEKSAFTLGNRYYLKQIKNWASEKKNDAILLKSGFNKHEPLQQTVREKCRTWRQALK